MTDRLDSQRTHCASSVLHVVVVEDVEPRHLVRLGVGALVLLLGDIDVAFLALVQE